MSQVYIWSEGNSSSTFLQLQRRINTHLLVSTENSKPWSMNIRVYSRRTDLKKATAYDAIAEALESTLMDGLIEVSSGNIPPLPSSSSSPSPSSDRSLCILQTSDDPSDVWVSIHDNSVHLSNTTMTAVENIFVPKKDADFKLRQSIKISGIQVSNEIRIGLISVGSVPSALWLEILSDSLIGSVEEHLLPKPLPDYLECKNVTWDMMRSWTIWIQTRSYMASVPAQYKSIANHFLNFERPSSWYPYARSLRRRIICHVGPTNSGKTHSALQSLIQSPGRTIYCAPLRLLAIEMYERLNKQLGIPCSLRTGEIICGPNGDMDPSQMMTTSCTVEMADLSGNYDVAVIDEVQMMADDHRGWAFTQAFLGLMAQTIYVCGEEAAVPLVQKLCEETGDTCEVVNFQRLSPLEIQDNPLGQNFSNIKPGDCVVAFSRRQIFDIKAQIEKSTNKKCAVVYGNLPMESRSQQARLFNEAGSDYNMLVASDAIGMGLNLNIKRIIFSNLKKFDGLEIKSLAPNQVKQIAGRAGRYKSSHDSGGLVTALLDHDLKYVKKCIETSNNPIYSAGLLPTSDHIVNLAHAIPSMTLPMIIDLYQQCSTLNDSYFLCHFRDMRKLAKIMEIYENISMKDRFKLACAPVKIADEICLRTFKTLIANFDRDILCKLKVAVPKVSNRPESVLEAAESVYRSLDLYLWLSTHFPERFTQVEEARAKRDECASVVDKSLEMICNVRIKRKERNDKQPFHAKKKMERTPEETLLGPATFDTAEMDEIEQIINRLEEESSSEL